MAGDPVEKLCKAVSQILMLIEHCGRRETFKSNLKALGDTDFFVVAFPVQDIERLRGLVALVRANPSAALSQAQAQKE